MAEQLPKTFVVLPRADTQAMLAVIDGFDALLKALHQDLIPNRDYSRADLLGFCCSAVAGQRLSFGRTVEGSWSVAPDDDGMPGDARVEFILTPTYLVAAILSKVLQRHPEIAVQVGGYATALRSGLLFCTLRKLQGHGYDGMHGLLAAVGILGRGEVPRLLARCPELCPEMAELLRQVSADLAARLGDRATTGPWGEDYADGMSSAVEALRPLCGPSASRGRETGRAALP